MKAIKGIRNHLGLYCLGAMVLGFATGQLLDVDVPKELIPLALLLMLYPPMLDVDLRSLKKAFRRPCLPATSLLINFCISPVLAYGVAYAASLSGEPSVMIGLLLFAMIPCGGMVPAYTGMLKGNVNLSVAITCVSLLMSVVIVPIWTKLLLGRTVPVPVVLVMTYLLAAIVLPMVLGIFTRRVVIENFGFLGFEKLKSLLKLLPGYGLTLLIFVVFSTNGRLLFIEPFLIMKIIVPAACFLLILLFAGTVLSRILNSSPKDETALTISTSAKNNAVAIAVGGSAFGTDVATVIAIIGPVVQLPIMLAYVRLSQAAVLRPLMSRERQNLSVR
ncbi:arsenic resistance protein [Thermodesulfobacteriota bacterium]